MRTNPYITRAILLGTAFAASSCMMGPDFKPVDMPMPAAFRGAPAATESIADLPWWKVFKNKDLQDLLTDTYNNNRDLKATMARVEKARQYITITEAPLFPWADYSGSVSKGSNYTGGSIAQTTGTTLTPGAIDAGISWELDIWGKTRRMTEAARADYLASEEGQRALMLSLLRQVADSYLQLLQLEKHLPVRPLLLCRGAGLPRGEQQQEHHIAAQAAPGREPQAGERAFHDCTPSFRSGISTRKVWPNTFPSSHKCSASSGGSWGRMIQRLTPE